MDEYVAHFHGGRQSPYFDVVRADSLDSDEHLHSELAALSQAGVDDVVLYPAHSSPDQVHLLVEALQRVGAQRNPTFEFTGR
jgi:hypothetical protein